MDINVDRKQLYELVDKIPESNLSELRMMLLKMAIPEVEATQDEIEAIERGRQEIANGESTLYTSFEELEKDIMKD